MSWQPVWTNTLSNDCPVPFDLIRKLMIVYWEFGNDSKSGYLSASCVRNYGAELPGPQASSLWTCRKDRLYYFSGIFIQLSSPKESFNV